MMHRASVMALIIILIIGAGCTGNVRFDEGSASVRAILVQPVGSTAPATQPDDASGGVIYFVNTKRDKYLNIETVEFYKIDPDGTHLTLIHSFSDDGSPIGFFISPDGKKIVYSGLPEDDIYVISVEGGPPVNLTNTPEWTESNPTWSPDGQRIAYDRGQDPAPDPLDPLLSKHDIYIMNADGTDPLNLTHNPGQYYSHRPVWSPDGRHLAFIASKPEGDLAITDLYLMNADGTNLLNLTASLDNDPTTYEWSADGQQLKFSTFDDNSYIVKADGTGLAQVTMPRLPGSDFSSNVTWSPDGQQLVFATTSAGLGRPRSILYIVNIAALSGQSGVQQTRLSEANFEEIGPIRWWAPASTPSPTPSPALNETGVDSAQSSLSVPPPEVAMPLLGWTISPEDGALFVVDATAAIYQLEPATLNLRHKIPPPFDPPAQPNPYVANVELLASHDYLFVGQRDLRQTLVFDRTDFNIITRFNQAGPMALDPGRRLLLITIPDNELVSYDLTNLNQPPQIAIPSRQQGNSWDRTYLDGLTVDSLNRRLYVAASGRPGSHACGSYERYNLDTFEYLDNLEGLCYGGVGTSSLSPEAGLVVGVENSSSGPLKSSLKLYNFQGEALKSISPFAGQALIDPAGDWLYVLRPSGLWALNAHDLTLPAALPFLDTPPLDLALSPNGQTLYLFGQGWLTALDTADFRTGRLKALPLTPPGPRPEQPFCTECGNLLRDFIPAYFYPSPQIEQDQTAFVQYQLEDYGHIYRTTDGGRSWSFLPDLSYPDFKPGGQLSLSPDYVRDHTLIAYTTGYSPFLSLDGGATWASWSPPIAFVSDRAGNRELYLMNQSGGDVRRLTTHLAADENPAWSPAWTRLAFQSNRAGNWDIFSIRVDCTLPQEPGEIGPECDLRQLTSDPADDILPAWSPDGRSIAFASTRDGNPEIYIMDANGQNQRRLTFNPTGDWRPAWFGDARRLAFTSDRSGNNDIYQLAVPTATLTLTTEPELFPLVTHPADDRDPAIYSWGEDRLLFLSNREGITRVYLMDSRSRTGEALTPHLPAVAHPAWDETGYKQLLIAVEQNGQWDIYAGNQYDGFTPLTDSPAFDGQPAWGPTRWLPTAATNQVWLNRSQP